MNDEFKIGEVVRLKSGGLTMTVGRCSDDQYECHWFASDHKRRASFLGAMLKRDGRISRAPDDVFEKYELILKKNRPATTTVERLTAPLETHVLGVVPSVAKLRSELNRIHGKSAVASEYEVRFADTDTKTFRGKGRVTLSYKAKSPKRSKGKVK